MTAREIEDELEIFLQRRRAVLSARLREPLEPSVELDRAVLKTARLAILPPIPVLAPAPPPRRRRWAVPVSAAAAVVLSLTLVIDLGVHALGTSEQEQTAQAEGVGAAAQIKEIPSDEDDSDAQAQAIDTSYSSSRYPRLAANAPASAPIFEVVIRSPRFIPIAHSSESANR